MFMILITCCFHDVSCFLGVVSLGLFPLLFFSLLFPCFGGTSPKRGAGHLPKKDSLRHLWVQSRGPGVAIPEFLDIFFPGVPSLVSSFRPLSWVPLRTLETLFWGLDPFWWQDKKQKQVQTCSGESTEQGREGP